MKLTKLPLSLAVAAAVCTSGAFAGESNGDGDSAMIDKSIYYNQSISNTGTISTMGLILVDSSAVAVSDVKQSSHANDVKNQFDTRNNANLADQVLTGATGNIGVNVAAGDNNVQQNSVAIANASSANNSINLQVDFTAGESNHSDGHKEANSSANAAQQSQSAWEVSGSASASSSMSDSVTVDSWDVHTDSTLTLDGDAVGVAGAVSGAATGGSAAWGGYVLGGGSAGGALFLNDKDTVQPGGEAGPVVVEGHETQGTYTATTSGNANGSAAFASEEASAYEVAGSASASQSQSSDAHQDSAMEHNQSHDDDYRLNVNFDADFVFGGSADAETFSYQTAFLNTTTNNGVVNTARIGDNVASDASGNIGINVAAGNSNVQTNQLAIANNDGVLSTATASSDQLVAGNTTNNNSLRVYETKSVDVALNGSATGTYEGTVTQDGITYLDIWQGSRGHPGGSAWGHADLDGDLGGDANGDENTLNFKESGDIALSSITLGGSVNYREVRYQGHRNNASLGDNALSNASGNIGMNIAAGTNNLQGNSLAISNVSIPTVPGNNPG